MPQLLNHGMEKTFVDRRSHENTGLYGAREQRQFVDSHAEFSPAARELAEAIDGYKLRHRRRFISHEELLNVIETLGYHK